MSARMHLDGCHFFAWVYENPAGDYELTWYERTADDLMMHMDDGDCERCAQLYNGAPARRASETVELPDDAKEAFFTVLAAIARLDSPASAGSTERSGEDG